MINKSEFLENKRALESEAIKKFEDLIILAKEGCPASNAVVCSFLGIISNMSDFLDKKNNAGLLELVTALQNGMYQMANNLNNQIEKFKSVRGKDTE